MIKPESIAKNKYLSSVAKLVVLVYLGYDRKKKLIEAGVSASVVYTNLLKLVTLKLATLDPTERIVLTEKGKEVAEKLLKCLEILE